MPKKYKMPAPDLEQYIKSPHLTLAAVASLVTITVGLFNLYKASKSEAAKGPADKSSEPKPQNATSAQAAGDNPELYGDGDIALIPYVGGIELAADLTKIPVYPTPVLDRSRREHDEQNHFPPYTATAAYVPV